MTLSAPRSRQSWFALALALVAVTAALVVGLLWSLNGASAVAPTPNDVTVTASDDIATDPVLPGTVVTYTFVIDAPSGSDPPTNDTYFYGAVDPNVFVTSVATGAGGVFQQAECGVFSDTEVECVDAAGPLTSDVVTVTGIVLNRIDYFLFQPYCEVGDDYFNDTVAPVRLGNLRNVFATCDVSGIPSRTIVEAAAPQDDTNAPNNPHVVVFTLEPGFVCNNDFVPNDNNRECFVSSDTCTFGPGNPNEDVCLTNNTAGATITNVDFSDCDFIIGGIPGNLNTQCDVTVTINAPNPGDVDIFLGHKFDPQTFPAGPAFIDLVPMVAEKTYAVAAAVGGELRHFDISDRYSEDAAGNVDGILDDQADIDDATGSFHSACITGTLLTDANNGDITWTITNHAGGSTTVDPPPAGQKIAGPINPGTGAPYPCVRWGSGGTGTQSITATYDDGVTPPETFYWDAVNALPLIKEWNDIDETHIVRATGDIACIGDITTNCDTTPGAPAFDNTLEMDDWAQRDCSFVPVNAGFCTRPNQDGLNIQAAGGLLANSPNPPFSPVVLASGVSFIDYTFGSHDDPGGAYDGPVDGALQTYTISGGCGAVRLEDPSDLDGDGEVVEILFPGDAQDVLSSDKGVGFEVLPNDDGALVTTPANANCPPGTSVTVTIATQEQFLFHSPPIRTVATETVTVTFVAGPLGPRAPYLAWVGQRVVVEADWGTYDAAGNHICPDFDAATGANPDEFAVFHAVENNGPGAFSSFLAFNEPGNDIDQDGRNAIVEVDFAAVPAVGINRPAPNSDCISRIIYSSSQPGRVDIVAYPTDDDDDLSSADPRGNPTHFTIYFMKFEDATLALNTTTSVVGGSQDATLNVSDSVDATLTVRGYSDDPYGDCDVKAAGVDPNGAATPANRCIFPDDWPDLAGIPGLGLHPELDIETSTGWATVKCLPDPRSAAPYSWLENTPANAATAAPVCGDSNAPHVAGAFACRSAAQVPCRETVFPDKALNAKDAPMPPSLARFVLTGAGFLTGVAKGASQFQFAHIPAEPWITPTNPFTLGGYMWNTWGAAGPKTGIYTFWTSLADQGPEVISCPGPNNAACTPPGPIPLCPNAPVIAPPSGIGCRTGGFNTVSVYTDNDGVAMVTVNGDANLDFSGCTQSPATAGNNIVFINGYYCPNGVLVGTSTLNATADYPDARPHPPVAAGPVTIDWTWDGTKVVTIEPDVPGQFHYIVFHVTDRDGSCGGSLHPTLGEQVNFVIDSPSGLIVPDANGNSAAQLGSVAANGKSATVFTFDTDLAANAAITQPVVVDGECQAWIHVSESLLNPVNILVTAFDPEGTITFDVITPTPTPTPSPSPSPTPTPAPSGTPWGDVNCDGVVDSVDALAVLDFVAHLPFNQTFPCHALDAAVTVDGTPALFGDIDFDGDVSAVDALAILLAIANLPDVPHTGPDVGDLVTIV